MPVSVQQIRPPNHTYNTVLTRACRAQRGRDASRRVYSDDCDSEADDYYSYDTSKQLKTFRVNTMPPINEWVRVEDGVSFQRCAALCPSLHWGLPVSSTRCLCPHRMTVSFGAMSMAFGRRMRSSKHAATSG